MAASVPQTLKNHARYQPLFHFFIMPVLLIAFFASIIMAVRSPGLHSIWTILVCAAVLGIAFLTRINALKVQDRVIRLEERLRLSTLLSEPLRSRIGELSEGQLIALRFAPDTEVTSLVEQTLAKRMEGKEIKQTIKNWRADDWRV